ncbi:hypothetical protein ACIQ1D_19220 [Lysinibacillus xylanilyticus]|uniref:hypothetical protein n=1 Tax=Lysinibacillus xylanilyticus TaxID=582475 RepID=UPI0037F79759
MNKFTDDETKHKKKSQKKTPKKSDHKHEYELIELNENDRFWFTHEKVCKICGHVYGKVRIIEY